MSYQLVQTLSACRDVFVTFSQYATYAVGQLPIVPHLYPTLVLAFQIFLLGFTTYFACRQVSHLFGYCFRRNHEILTARIAGMPCITKDKNVSAFRQEHVDRPFTVEGHKLNESNIHKDAARRRTAARHWIHTAILANGRSNYSINSSNADLYKGADGSRILRTPKDFVYYRQTKHDVATRHHHYSSIDDLDHLSHSQFSDLLHSSADLDSSIYSYMYMPTGATFKNDEFTVDYDPTTAQWKANCAEEDGYAHELWDNNHSIISHWSVGRVGPLATFLFAVLAAGAGLCLYSHLISTAPLAMTTPFGTWCYQWTNIAFPTVTRYLVPRMYAFELQFHNATYAFRLPTIWHGIPFWLRYSLAWSTIAVPEFVQCHDYAASALYATATAIIIFVCACFFKSFLGLRSGFHFNFHINCGENRTIWICHPAVRFGWLRTLWFAVDIYHLLPKRLVPTIINVPPGPLSLKGTKILSFTHIDQDTKERVFTYTIEGTSRSTVLDLKGYSIIKTHNLTNKNMLSVTSFQTSYGSAFKDTWTTDQILTAIHAVTYEDGRTTVTEHTRSPSVTYYRFRADEFVEAEPVSNLKPFFEGATRGCTYIPLSSRGNTEHGIATRITDVKPKDLPEQLSVPQERLIASFLHEYKQDISNNHANLLTPDEVFEKQSKPSQRRTNLEAMACRGSDWLNYIGVMGKTTQAFQKNEAAMKPGDPRNITTMPPVVRLQNSRIALALAGNMKKTKWYAFGLKPRQVAERVAQHVSDPRTHDIALGDYSRMDGTVNHLIRQFDLAFLKANFDPRDHEEIETWYRTTYTNKVRAGRGVSYEQGDTQASGDPYTSALNTARNAFICFCCLAASTIPVQSPDGTLCEDKTNNGKRLTDHAAYKNLGLVAGDDSIQRNIAAAQSIRTALEWGFVLKFEFRKRGEPVDFLARQYSPAVWIHCPDNVCSPLRMISKFHVSTLTDSVPRDVIAYTKAMSILTNDHSTLLIGAWMRMIVKQTRQAYVNWCKNASETKLELVQEQRHWNDKWANGTDAPIKLCFEPGPHSYQDSMDAGVEWQIALFLKQFTPEGLHLFENFLSDPKALWHQCPILAEHDAKPADFPYIANGCLVDPSTPVPSKNNILIEEINEKLINSVPQNSDGSTPQCSPSAPPTSAIAEPKLSPAVGKTCKRGNKVTGWYAGLEPCTNVVPEHHSYCKECNVIYRANRPATVPDQE